MRRELATLGVTALFGLSLAATSKPHGTSSSTSSSATPVPLPSDTSVANPATVALPDTTTWKPFVSPATKLTAKTPPGARVACTKTSTITVCTVARGMNVFAFSRGGRSAADIAREMRGKKPGTILFDSGDALVVHRSDPELGEYCEYVTTSEPKLVSVAVHVDGTDPAGFKAIAPKDQDCLDVVAFAATLRSTP
jgi:hypothetical protein